LPIEYTDKDDEMGVSDAGNDSLAMSNIGGNGTTSYRR